MSENIQQIQLTELTELNELNESIKLNESTEYYKTFNKEDLKNELDRLEKIYKDINVDMSSINNERVTVLAVIRDLSKKRNKFIKKNSYESIELNDAFEQQNNKYIDLSYQARHINEMHIQTLLQIKEVSNFMNKNF